jgi:hypothetical protein
MNKNTDKVRRTPRKVGEYQKITDKSGDLLCNTYKSWRTARKVGESPINLVESPRNRGEP